MFRFLEIVMLHSHVELQEGICTLDFNRQTVGILPKVVCIEESEPRIMQPILAGTTPSKVRIEPALGFWGGSQTL